VARKAMIAKSLKKPKFKVRQRNRCRLLALEGYLPGVTKASW